MPEIWLFLGLQAIALVGGAITGGIALALGGAGGLRSLRTAQKQVQQDLDRVDDRITREVKTRASLAAKATRSDAELTAEAQQRLGDGPPSLRSDQRPSVAHLGR